MKVALLVAEGPAEAEPFLGLALGLMKAGHDVRLACGLRAASLATARGIRSVALSIADLRGDMIPGGAQRPARESPLSGFSPIPSARRLLAGAWRAVLGSDVVVYHPGMRAAALLAERLGVPAIAASTQPPGSLGSGLPPPVPRERANPPPPTGGAAGRGAAWRVPFAGIDATLKYRPRVARRPTVRLAPKRRFGGWGSGSTILYAMSRHLVDPVRLRPGSALTGYWFADRPESWAPPADLARFLESGSPPVYVDLGDTMPIDPDRAAWFALDALSRAGLRGILRRGACSLRPSGARLPGHVFVVEEAPLDWLLPRVPGVVIHAGAGPVASALRAGSPMVVIPFTREQRFWARRVHRRGAAPAPIFTQDLCAATLADAMAQVVNDDLLRARARALGARVRQEDGIRRAVTLIERALPASRRTAPDR